MVSYYSGQDLREMSVTATAWLKKSASDINALNVFPVPDGDCGTNMLLTMNAMIEEAYRAPDRSASAVASAAAFGALMGARGNSGVILSQVWQGFSKTLEEKESFAPKDFAQALLNGANLANKALANPVEGTIITVVREAARAAMETAEIEDNLVSILESSVAAAQDAVANTPNLLPVLKQAGVVDAGGQGLYVLLDGMLMYLRGEKEDMEYRHPQVIAPDIEGAANLPRLSAIPEDPYGYCTSFVIKGKNLDVEKLQKELENKGKSLIIAGDEQFIKLHIHTFDPGEVLRLGTTLGTIHEIEINNMDDQYQQFLKETPAESPQPEIATVVVASGKGLMNVFRSLGAISIIPGGQTMNPSVEEILKAVESVSQSQVIILPNNKNIIPAAEQAAQFSKKKLAVIPTRTIPQGIAAILSFNYEVGFEENVAMMEESFPAVKTLEITQAIRSTQIGDMKIKEGQMIGFVNDEVISVGDDADQLLLKMLSGEEMSSKEILTLYYGSDVKEAESNELSRQIRQHYPHLQIEVVNGEQPYYHYIVSVE
ncbi:MAG: DAK2 domain-containing protein [candidate division WOR-3 bacterium]|nr:DAK2 domain-containing protein [candidate division WOR-3 bacterium]